LGAIVAGLTAGIIAAIVVGAFITFATLSGGVYAAATGASFESSESVKNNPLYAPSEVSGDNPFFTAP
jgi:hypothetical protein